MSDVDQQSLSRARYSAAELRHEPEDDLVPAAQRSGQEREKRMFCTIVVVEVESLAFPVDGEDPVKLVPVVLDRIRSSPSAFRGDLIGSNENCFYVSFALPRQAADFCVRVTSESNLHGLSIRCGADTGWMGRHQAIDAPAPLESAVNAVQQAACGDVLFTSRAVGFLGDSPGSWEEVTSKVLKRVARSEFGGTASNARKSLATRARSRFGRALGAKEREVAVLIAKGASNRGIANAMSISVSTVERHVSNVFLKLNLTSRLEITLLAAQGRLV